MLNQKRQWRPLYLGRHCHEVAVRQPFIFLPDG